MPNVHGVLRKIGKWKYMVVTDLLKSFYQIPLVNSSMKYCDIATPFKGIHVYTRSAMGMPGSETCLKELMSRVLGNLIQEGCVAKIADDLYVGGNTPIEDYSTIGAEFLPSSKRTIFACLPPKQSSAPKRPLYYARCGLAAPYKLAPTSWPSYLRWSLLR